jgi:hypothetical protein
MGGIIFICVPMGILPDKHKLRALVYGCLAFLAMLPVTAWAQSSPTDAANEGWEVKTVFGITIKGGGTDQAPLSDLIGNILNILYVLAGSSAILMVIIGGYRYMSSTGDPKGIQEAKETIKSALIGLMLVLLAYLIAQFIGDSLGINLLETGI